MAEPAASAGFSPESADSGILAQWSATITRLSDTNQAPKSLSDLQQIWQQNPVIQAALAQSTETPPSQKWIEVPEGSSGVRVTTYSLRQFCQTFISATQTVLFQEQLVLKPEAQETEAGQLFQKIFRLQQNISNIWQLLGQVNTVVTNFDNLFVKPDKLPKKEEPDSGSSSGTKSLLKAVAKSDTTASTPTEEPAPPAPADTPPVSAPVSETTSATIPFVAFNPNIFSSTDQATNRAVQRTNTSYQIVSIHTAFLQNQLAESLFRFHKIEPQGRAFDQLPPELKYIINSQISQSLYVLSAENITQLDRYELGQRLLRQLTQTDDRFRVELKTFLQEYVQANPTAVGEAGAKSTEQVVAEIDASLPTEVSVEAVPVVTNYNQGVAQQFASLPVSEPALKAEKSFQQLVETGYLSQDAGGMSNELAHVGKQLGLTPNATLNLEQFINEAVLRHEDPFSTMFTLDSNSSLPFRAELKTMRKEHLDALKRAGIHFWEQRLALFQKTLQSPIVGSIVSLPEDPEVLEKIVNVTPGNIPDVTMKPEVDAAFAERQLAIAQLRPEKPDINYATKLTIAFHTSPEHLKTQPSRDSIEQNFLYPIYGYPDSVRASYNQILAQNLAAQETVLNFTGSGSEKMSIVEQVRKRYYFSISQSPEVLEWSTDQASAQIPPYLFWDEADNYQTAHPDVGYYDPGAGGQSGWRNAFQPRRWKQLADRIRGVDKAKKVAEAAKTVSEVTTSAGKINRLTQALKQVVTVAKKARDAFNIAKLVAAIKAGISALLGLLGPIGSALLALGGGLVGALGFLPVAGLVGGAIAGGIGLISSILGVSAPAATGATAATASSATPGGGLLERAAETAARAKEAAKTFASSAGGKAVAITTGMGVAGSLTMMTLQGAFLTDVPTLGPTGETSPYVSIEKQAIRQDTGEVITGADEITGPIPVTYRITITPKEDYTISLKRLNDSQLTEFNEALLEEEGRTVPTLSPNPKERLYDPTEEGEKNPELADDITRGETEGSFPELSPGESLTIEYNDTFDAQFQDSSVTNTFSIRFDYKNEAGDEAGVDEIATVRHYLCFGECPRAKGGCWPITGDIGQLPYGEYTHAVSSLEQDAYDIMAEVGVPVYAPFAGQVCPGNLDYRYGDHATMRIDNALYNGQVGTMYLIFAHLDTLSPQVQNGCVNVTESDLRSGFLIGVNGASGNAGGNPHLHYEARWNTLSVTGKMHPSLIEQHVPEPVVMFDKVRSCYE